MKTWKRALALVLALVMALSLVALPSFAAGEEDSAGNGSPRVVYEGASGENNGGLVMSKTVTKGEGDDQFLLTLEAFATGTTRTDTKEIPLDIVLVLDTSSSMSRDFDGNSWLVEDKDRRLTALKNAVNNFAESVAAKAKGADGQYGGGDDVDYRIAVVKFANSASNLTNGLIDMNTSQGLTQVKNAVSGLRASGDTYPATGLDMANSIFDANPISSDEQRGRVVVLFTDGYPAGANTNNLDCTLCDNAIASARVSKGTYGATVYTVGIFSGADPNSDIDTNFVYNTDGNRLNSTQQLVAANRYMHYTSSNFQNAQSLQNGGEKSGSSYYLVASDANSLNDVFKSISQTIGSTPVELTSISVLRDVISDSFTLPEGYKDGDIKAYSVSCESSTKNADGTYTYTWKTTPDADKYDVTVADDNKTINVTDFDYAANWVDQYDVGGSKSHGKKLVVQIPIVLDPDATGSVDTNGPASGIYASADAEAAFANFKTPTVYVPFFTVAHVESRVNDQGKNFGQETSRKDYPLWRNKEFNLTSVVTENCLYGGTFNEETCTTVHDKVEGRNPMAIAPVENETYYIWEVPNTYLRPFTFYVWQHVDGKKTVTKLYPLVGVDRTKYANVGFSVCWDIKYNKDNAVDIPSGCTELSASAQAGTAEVYQYLLATKSGVPVESWYLQNGKATNYMGDITTTETIIDEGCIGGFRLDAQQFENFKTKGITYRPYWITLDGVRVDSVRSRTLTFKEGSDKPIYDRSLTGEYSAGYTYVNTPAAQTLSFRTCMLADDSQPVVDERLTVTVVDGSNTTQVKVAPNGSVRDQVAYQAPAGKVFAGWFADQACTTPADLDQVTQDTTIYAKYVSDSYLDLAYSRTGLFRLRGVTLISAVDNPANYQASGIMVNGQKLDVSYASRYRIFKTPANLFGAARDAKLMLADKSLSGTGTLEVTPYWVTLDGTEVHGVTHTLHYNTRTIWE